MATKLYSKIFPFRDEDVRLLLLIVASSFIIISMMVVIGVVSCILLCFEDSLHDEEELIEHILQVRQIQETFIFNLISHQLQHLSSRPTEGRVAQIRKDFSLATSLFLPTGSLQLTNSSKISQPVPNCLEGSINPLKFQE